MTDTRVTLCGVELKNPVMTASGTFGSGHEYAQVFDLSALGAVVTKGVANVPWPGNEVPRVAETPSGMLNAIGLQNPGVDTFIKEDLSFLSGVDTGVIVNVCGRTISDYCQVVERLSEEPAVDMLEINVSCPNVKEGGIAFGVDKDALAAITREVRRVAKKPIILKLSPNVSDIALMGRVAQENGADALSLINTLMGMKIDIYRRRPLLANRTGGLSGPAIRPVAVRMVNQVAKAVTIPIIGMGGITCGEDAIEFLMAGASAVAVGTATFHDPVAPKRVAEGIQAFMEEQGVEKIQEIVGII